MKLINCIKAMKQFSSVVRNEGKKIALVPTMGYLHKGHYELLREGKALADITVLSIFVNPMQFGTGDDFTIYPANLERDLDVAEKASVDVVFHPDREELYPDEYQTFVEVRRLRRNLCGLFRPGHFDGVATIVLKLFNIIRPHVAIFGEKDFQQLMIVRRLVADLNLDVEVKGHPVVREDDGLAASSRNSYLKQKEREAATVIWKALNKGMEMFEDGERDAREIVTGVESVLKREHSIDIEYVKVCDVNTLDDIYDISKEALLAIVIRIGRARLIDNCILR